MQLFVSMVVKQRRMVISHVSLLITASCFTENDMQTKLDRYFLSGENILAATMAATASP